MAIQRILNGRSLVLLKYDDSSKKYQLLEERWATYSEKSLPNFIEYVKAAREYLRED